MSKLNRATDFKAPGTEPPPIRVVRKDMIQEMVSNPRIGLLDTKSWTMARSRTEKTKLMDKASMDELIVAWAGNRWLDFFEFRDHDLFLYFKQALIIRQSVMVTEDELDTIQALRAGEARVVKHRPKT